MFKGRGGIQDEEDGGPGVTDGGGSGGKEKASNETTPLLRSMST